MSLENHWLETDNRTGVYRPDTRWSINERVCARPGKGWYWSIVLLYEGTIEEIIGTGYTDKDETNSAMRRWVNEHQTIISDR